MPAAIPSSRRPSRFRLYLPFILLGLLVVGWSAAWFLIRSRTTEGMDKWLAAEAAQGRNWTCADRTIGGYPFRIELSCKSLAFERTDLTATLGRVTAITQIYKPGHIIIEAAGPLRATGANTTVESTWRLLQASVILSGRELERLALVADAPVVRAVSPDTGSIEVTAKEFEVHARPDPKDSDMLDLAFSAEGAVLPGLDALVGGTEPSDLDLVLRLSRATQLAAGGRPPVVERWRLAGGQVEIDRLRIVKGQRRVEATGNASIDDLRRPQGRLDAQVAGIEGLLGQFIGDKAGIAGNLLGALLGQSQRGAQIAQPADPKAPRLKPLPPVRIDNGRLFVGPLQLPNMRIPALY